MPENFELKQQIEQISDPEVLKSTLFALLSKIDSLEQRLSSVDEKHEGNERMAAVIAEKRDRLERIRHGLTEMNERMERPYVVSAELQAVKEVMDVLAEAGECNSVILEGEPGTGKTQWAYSEVGQELQEGEDVTLVHVRVKDTMRAQDLLYSIDDVRRLSDAQAQAQVPEQIRQEASAFRQKILDAVIDPTTDKAYLAFKSRMNAVVELGETAKDLDYLNYVDLGPLGEAIYQSGKGKKVYLVIDEIEKGREELMTGILDEIENLTFTIGETGTVVKGDKKNLRIVITTNTEDSDKIPPSFRRRSLYHFIDYPGRADMAKIVELNFPNIQKELISYAIQVFYRYHEHPEVEKKPSTPELLAWIKVLSGQYDFSQGIPQKTPHLGVLLKYPDDQEVDIGSISITTEDASGERRVMLDARGALEQKIEQLRLTIEQISETNEQLEQGLRETQKRLAEIESEKEGMDEEILSVKTELQESLTKLGKYQEKIEELESALEEEDDEDYDEDDDDEDEEDFESRIEELETQIDTIKRERDNEIGGLVEQVKMMLDNPGFLSRNLKTGLRAFIDSRSQKSNEK